MVEVKPMRSAICCPIPCVTKKSEISSLGFMIKGSKLKVKGERLKAQGLRHRVLKNKS